MARIGLLGFQLVPFRFTLTLRAGMALTKAHVEQVLKASLIGRELLKKLANVGLVQKLYIENSPPYVKGIHPFTVANNSHMQLTART